MSPTRVVFGNETGRFQAPDGVGGLLTADPTSLNKAGRHYVAAYRCVQRDTDLGKAYRHLKKAAHLWEKDGHCKKSKWASFLASELEDTPEHVPGLALWLGPAYYFEEARSPTGKMVVAYTPHVSPDPRHSLDLYVPAEKNFPTAVFLHGGGWTFGSKIQRFGKADVYANWGRYLASRGIGAAIANYRLIPEANCDEQIADAAQAYAWVQSQISIFSGGDPDRVFLGGYSAGAQLAARVALDGRLHAKHGIDASRIAGAFLVSGSGLDVTDPEIYELNPFYLPSFAERFSQNRPRGEWQREVSPALLITPKAPPFLVLSGEKEPESLRRQSRRFAEKLRSFGARPGELVVPGLSHGPMMLALSNPKRGPAEAVVDFIQRSRTT